MATSVGSASTRAMPLGKARRRRSAAGGDQTIGRAPGAAAARAPVDAGFFHDRSRHLDHLHLDLHHTAGASRRHVDNILIAPYGGRGAKGGGYLSHRRLGMA
ncbi:hypothetical protein G6F68_018705 [Rhizopus microsporus]|nr:hypothetical protein G6F68_018705 [Rhizopus microsporus]